MWFIILILTFNLGVIFFSILDQPEYQLSETPLELTPKRAWLRLVPHPWLLGICLLAPPLEIGIVYPLNALSSTCLVLLFIAWLVSWISSLIIAARERRRVWLIVLILTLGLAAIFFSIFDQPVSIPHSDERGAAHEIPVT